MMTDGLDDVTSIRSRVEMVGMTPDLALATVDDYLAEDPGGLGHAWSVVGDASVADGFELRSPPLRYSDLSAIEAIVGHLTVSGARGAPDRAGVHVHADAESLSVREIVNVVELWDRVEPALRWQFDVHPRRSLLYCRPARTFAALLRTSQPSNMTELRSLWLEDRPGGCGSVRRHRSLNLESLFERGTIEFRLFGSSGRPCDLRRAVSTALAVVEASDRPHHEASMLPTKLPRTAAEGRAMSTALRLALGFDPRAPSVVRPSAESDDCAAPVTHTAVGTVVTFTSRHGHFAAPSFAETFCEMLLEGFFDVIGTARFSETKGSTIGETAPHVPVAASREDYARAVLESLDARGIGSLAVEDAPYPALST
jgi:hypothetical protein